MSVIVNACEATTTALMPLAKLLEACVMSSRPSDASIHYYEIKYFQKSVSAWILFVQDDEDLHVLKLLCNYKDERYNLETAQKRRMCQFEAFQCNSRFSPDVYYGLTRIVAFDATHKVIGIERSFTYSFNQEYASHTEFALVMRCLPEYRRLDYLLDSKYHTVNELYILIHFLTSRVVDIHEHLSVLSIEESKEWGSFPQQQKKLEHNLALATPILENQVTVVNAEQRRGLCDIQKRFEALRNTLLRAFTCKLYAEYMEERVLQGKIKQCHGDLKAPNIWIEETDEPASSKPSFTAMHLLDAIDFNKMYSNIDTLSDFATLVVDIQTRTEHPHSEDLAQRMIVLYLDSTSQNNEICQTLTYYYLVEKAYVGAALSMVYDNLPELGLAFLEVAEFWSKLLLVPTVPSTPNFTPIQDVNTIEQTSLTLL